MLYLGDYKAARTVDFAFDTEVNGLPSPLSAATVKVYKGSSSTTEVTTGVTHTEDFDALTGFNHVTVDLSSDGAFYAAGNDFMVVLTSGTLNGSTIRRVLAHFSIENRCANWAQVGSPTTAVGLTGTTIATSQVVASVTGAVGSVTGNVGGNVNGAVGSVTGSVGGNVNGNVAGSVGSVTAFSAAAVQSIWDALTSALTTAGSIGKRLADFITGDAYVRLGAPAAASVSADIAAINAKTTNLPATPAAVGSAMTLTAGERTSVADALLDRADAVEVGLTPRQALRLEAAAAAGKLSGAATATVTLRNAVADSKNRIVATVDVDGNRSAVTTDVS